MGRKNLDLEKQTMNYRRGDWDFLNSILAPRGIATSEFIRELVSKKVDALRAQLDPQPEEISIDD